jgi:hypothetical protein
MKKYFLIIAIIGIAIVAIFSCRKSIEPVTNPNQQMTPSSETELRIQSFLNRSHDNLKVGKTYSIDSAIYYVEGALNYTYAIYDSDFVYLSRESSLFSINLNRDNTVNESDLISTYNKMIYSLEAQFDNIQSFTKHLMICDIINVSNSVGRLDLKMISVIVYNYNPNYYGSFGPTDYWYAGANLGKCNGYTGYGDAAQQLQYKLLHPLVANVSNVRIYHFPVITVWDIDPYFYDYTPAPREKRGYYFRGPDNSGIQCLPPSELNFYLSSNGIPYIINDNNLVSGYEFSDIVVRYDYMAGDDYWVETHKLDISYGIRNETIVGASTL